MESTSSGAACAKANNTLDWMFEMIIMSTWVVGWRKHNGKKTHFFVDTNILFWDEVYIHKECVGVECHVNHVRPFVSASKAKIY